MDLINRIRDKFKDSILEAFELKPKRVVVKVSPSKLKELARFLRDDLNFDYLIGAGGIDFKKEDIIQVVYYLFSTTHKTLLMLKVDLPRENPTIDSLVEVWEAVDYHERETWEMLGVNFVGHPNLTRLLLPEDWKEGFPLRKDFDLSPYQR